MQQADFDTTDSTNLQARRLWVERRAPSGHTPSPAEPIVVTAAQQTAGMGRAGRSWLSPRGGLWLTIAWPLQKPLEFYQPLPLIVGLATAGALEQTCSLPCQIKWPNDIFVRERKLVGILCQAEPNLSPPVVLIGIGINGNFPSAQLGTRLRHPPTTLLDELHRPCDLSALRAALLALLFTHLAEFEHAGLAPLLQPIRDRLAWFGQVVCCTDMAGQTLAAGPLVGLDATGRILIQAEGRVTALATGELQLAAADPIVP